MKPCVFLALAIVVCHGNEHAAKETSNNSKIHESKERGNTTSLRLKRENAKNQKVTGLPPPNEDLLELMVRIAETPQEWERIQKVLNALGVEERSKKGTNSTNDSTIVKENKLKENNNTIDEVNVNNTYIITTTVRPHIQNVTFKKRRKGNRRKEHVKMKKAAAISIENKEDGDNRRWSKFVQTKKRVRDRRDEGEDDSDEGRWPQPDEWLQPVRFRHGRQDILWSESEKEDWPTASVQDKVKWTPSNDNSERDGETENKAVIQETRTSSNWQKNNGSWPESARSRAEFSYHRVTANPRERHKAATAFVAVSVVKNKAPPPPSHKTHPPPWSHARHLHRLQEQLKSLSAAKARLRHHWFEKERLHQSLLEAEKQNETEQS
ncbi:uncharacterized protein LOC142324457 [Lycorma delicatula]|uniref:uncharacterized protein LOC142324457 n=1 Tax=Lycorma delicatula TaxID=130591 RepID=UPI003F50EDA6